MYIPLIDLRKTNLDHSSSKPDAQNIKFVNMAKQGKTKSVTDTNFWRPNQNIYQNEYLSPYKERDLSQDY